MTAGRESPQSTPAMLRCAKNTSALEKMFPLHRSGTTRMSATPATGPSTPFCRAASGDMALSSASGPAYDRHLLVDVRGDVDRHVRDDYEAVHLGHLDERGLAQQLARLAKARLLVQDRVHEGRGVHEALHGHVRLALAHELHGQGCGGLAVGLVDDAVRGRVLPRRGKLLAYGRGVADQDALDDPAPARVDDGGERVLVVGARERDPDPDAARKDLPLYLLKGPVHAYTSSFISSAPESAR